MLIENLLCGGTVMDSRHLMMNNDNNIMRGITKEDVIYENHVGKEEAEDPWK